MSENSFALENRESEAAGEDEVKKEVENEAEELVGTEPAEVNEEDVNIDDGSIMPFSAENPAPVATLTVSGDLSQVNSTGPGQTVYRSHGITVNLQDVTSYSLQVSYASDTESTLKYDGIGNAYSNIEGAGGRTGNAMMGNTWGYAWSDDISSDDASLVYQTMPNFSAASGKALKVENASGNDVITKVISGKLVFAARFADTAPLGHYKAKVLLSLAAAPKSLVHWADLTAMQEMNNTACAEAPYGTSRTLRDTRDDNSYTVVKFTADGRCWMTQNLRLINKEITNNDSDITDGSYVVPANSDSWVTSGSDYYQQRVHNGSGSASWKNEYGYYYTWCAATAGTCNAVASSGAVASGSICPKGWRLPTEDEYSNLLTTAHIESSEAGSTKLRSAPYNFTYTGDAGSSLRDIGSWGNYWSSTASSSAAAYGLRFGSSYITTNNNGYGSMMQYGYSVRCIAK